MLLPSFAVLRAAFCFLTLALCAASGFAEKKRVLNSEGRFASMSVFVFLSCALARVVLPVGALASTGKASVFLLINSNVVDGTTCLRWCVGWN